MRTQQDDDLQELAEEFSDLAHGRLLADVASVCFGMIVRCVSEEPDPEIRMKLWEMMANRFSELKKEQQHALTS